MSGVAVDVYEDRAPVPFVSGMMMRPAEAKAAVEMIKEMQRSVMTADVDYGIVPGTERPALFKSGAELLLKVHGFGHHCEPVEVERDEHGRKYGVTYRCTVTVGNGAHEVVVATCDGYCGYDESKYYQSVTTLEARERANAAHYQRKVNELKFAEEYRAPWNTLVKMAIKRALVGAALQATAASGLFTQDVEDGADNRPQSPAGPPRWQKLGYADADEEVAVNEGLIDLSKQVPEDQRDKVGKAMDSMGYTRENGSRFPVAKADVDSVRTLLKAAVGGTDVETGEIPTQAPATPEATAGVAEDATDDGRPFDDMPDDEDPPWLPDLFNAWTTPDELGNVTGRRDLLDALIADYSDGDLAEMWQAVGGDLFSSVEEAREGLAVWVITTSPVTEVTSNPHHMADPDPGPDGQQSLDGPPPEQPKRKQRTKGSQVHAQLAILGVKDKADQEAIIKYASGGLTVHANDLTDQMIQVAYGFARQIAEGTMTTEEIRRSAANLH